MLLRDQCCRRIHWLLSVGRCYQRLIETADTIQVDVVVVPHSGMHVRLVLNVCAHVYSNALRCMCICSNVCVRTCTCVVNDLRVRACVRARARQRLRVVDRVLVCVAAFNAIVIFCDTNCDSLTVQPSTDVSLLRPSVVSVGGWVGG